MIPKDTPYKVIKYLVKLSEAIAIPKNYLNDKYIIYLLDRKLIVESPSNKNKFIIAEGFMAKYNKEILPIYQRFDSFIKGHQFENIENHYSIDDLQQLMSIDIDKPHNLTFQEVLSKYFKSSKHTKTNSNLANAIKVILGIVEFAEDDKDQQFISILYPKNETRFIILCENINRLKAKRHDFIEFWYAGGKNTNQLKYVPEPKYPIFYLCDWDFDGLNTYIHIKKNYFKTMSAFVPLNIQPLMEKQENVKHHRSKWRNSNVLSHLKEKERIIASLLIETDSIIEEQKILIDDENLNNNGIN